MFGRHGFKFGRGGCGQGFEGEFMRMRRGDIKFHLLEILKETPRHGYEIINKLENQSGGYRPSPGSVYPTLQMLEEGGYLTSEQIEGKKVYTITDEGIKFLEDRGAKPFEAHPKMAQAFEIRKSLMKFGSAVMDGVRDGDEETVKKISEVINKAKRDVYSILAES
ncbi:MAG: PadR family transcriptional regulator [Acidobacteriota bacterium]|jgi:DNA-binding PadR family transcriptional regulator|nr:PadR family transcriptional regulator [Acidobacteriota bacterium]